MPRREIEPAELLAALPLFRALSASAVQRIAGDAVKLQLDRGEVLFARGDLPAGFYVVVYGQIALYAPGRGHGRLTGLVGAGRSFGEPVMFLDKPALVAAIAQRDTLVVRVPKAAVFAEIERNPAFARLLLAGLSARIERLVHELDARTQGSARQRLAAYLLRLAQARSGAADLTLPAGKAAIASQLGMTPEHLSRLLRSLQDEGVLQVAGRRVHVVELAAVAGALRAGARRASAGRPPSPAMDPRPVD